MDSNEQIPDPRTQRSQVGILSPLQNPEAAAGTVDRDFWL